MKYFQTMISKRILLLVAGILIVCGLLPAQTKKSDYDNDMLPAQFHADRRQALRDKMEPNSVAVIFTNPERNRSNDVDFKYSPAPDFYYLCGYTEPNAVLIIFKEKQTIDSISTSEILYVQPRNATEESWTGRRLGTEGVKKQLGIVNVYGNVNFDALSLNFCTFDKIYQSESYNDVRDDQNDKGDLYSLIKQCKEKTDFCKSKRNSFSLRTLLAALREIKTPEEMMLLKKAIDITCDSHKELMRNLDTSMTEYQAQALVEFGFSFNGSEYPGYPSIVGGGENSCILHYVTNRKKLHNPELLVVDAGAEYHGYTADVTRTLPVNGKFTKDQKALYDVVLKAQLAGIKQCRKDNNFRDPHNAAVEVVKKGLISLGIITEPNDFAKYFFHGTSHYLGLDVHDAGTYGKLKAGSVITVEPGIYIPEGSSCDKKWWNMGIRIEDDVLITEGEPDVLSGKLAKTTEEVEKMMAEEGILKKK
ncbi:MAG: Xaa-Pro aminopeptidase [Bacteroidetes bacterium]|nr:Xaa-Pro aminopeptidase [Bacteroidota bacterium]